jgi:hypothetical protein
MKEIRVYLVDFYNYEFDDNDSPYDFNDERFMSEAEKQGNVYSLIGFQYAYNKGDINCENSYIRIINPN